MPDDIFRDDWEDDCDWNEKAKPATKRGNGGSSKDSLSTVKDYLIVALIAVIVFMGANNYIFARSGNGGLSAIGGGCCGGGGDAVSFEEMRLAGLQYYVEKYGDSDVEATVEDFGCHQEIYIYKDGAQVARIGYAYGEVYEF